MFDVTLPSHSGTKRLGADTASRSVPQGTHSNINEGGKLLTRSTFFQNFEYCW